MAVLPGLLIVAALFALAFAARLGFGARRVRWSVGWKSWVAFGVGAGLLMAGRWGGALAFAGIGVYLARPRLETPQEPAATVAARVLLGVGPGASDAAIRAAYRRKMARAHPDAGGAATAAQALTEARDLLLRKP